MGILYGGSVKPEMQRVCCAQKTSTARSSAAQVLMPVNFWRSPASIGDCERVPAQPDSAVPVKAESHAFDRCAPR